MSDAAADSARLAGQLRAYLERRSALPVEVVETHISWVLLAGATAYKLKKPIVLPFLDFSRLEARRRFCEEELRLNRRLAKALYLGVSRITGTPDAPQIDGSGPAIDYAVRMRRFPPGSLLAEHAAAGTLTGIDIDRLALRLGSFHAQAPRAEPANGFGSPERRGAAALAACEAVAAFVPSRADEWNVLRSWLQREAAALAPQWAARRAAGCVREGHGDLHLDNLLLLDDEPTAFDAIEFDPALRWIDIVDDAAFVAMDLLAHGRRDLAFRFINAWLDATGDHEGLPLWRFAMVYRALVRAQVGLIREQQRAKPAKPPAAVYTELALRLADERADPRLLITHGLPGAGKSVAALALAEHVGAIRLRSDVERKRLAGLRALSDSRGVGDLYGADATRRTYERLAALACIALQAGWPTIVDAAFLRRDERDRFAALAAKANLPFAMLDCRAPVPLLRERVAARRARGDDPSEADAAVLDRLAARRESLSGRELAVAIIVDSGQPIDAGALAAVWRATPHG